MGVNVGGLFGPIVCGYLGESPRWGWHYGFGAAGIGMLCGLAFYLRLGRATWAGSAIHRRARRPARDHRPRRAHP